MGQIKNNILLNNNTSKNILLFFNLAISFLTKEGTEHPLLIFYLII